MNWRRAVIVLLALWVIFEIGRSLTRVDGVIFTGYTQVGEAVLQGGDPYGLTINTWPPFFLFIAALLALLARISLQGALLLWQIGSVAAIWGVLRLLPRLSGAAPARFDSPAVLVPLLMTARLLQEHLQHTQINLYVLFLIVLAFFLFHRRRNVAGGLSLAAAVSLRAVPLLFVVYLLYKRAWAPAAWTAGFVLVLNLVLPMAALGPQAAAERWGSWRAVAARETVDPTPVYSNQSLLAALKRLLTTEGGARDPVRYAVADWPLAKVQILFRLLVGAGVLALGLLLWRHPPGVSGAHVAGEVAVLLALMTLVSPLAWKAHFVTLLVGYWVVWRARDGGSGRFAAGLWWGSFACLTLSASALVGGRLSHILESWNVITVGALLVIVMTLRAIKQLQPQPPASFAAPSRP
jgi:alpha-1,2-mannosyltransferase